jgi:A/G-specific adenine glycosylase
VKSFAQRIVEWQATHGRHTLPWQGADAYRVWLSEIMLQQTQVATVIPYYRRFVASFPHIRALAAASEDEVLAHWSGLGYYARGRNLHRAAKIISEKYGGQFPRDFDAIMELPGIGRSTAAAICALAYHECRAILDGNVKRVLARRLGMEGWPGDKSVEAQLWQHAEALLPSRNIAAYTQGLMDLGASVCTRSKPKCDACPARSDCVALNTGRIAELPAARPRKNLPEKHACLLLLVRGNDILLEKRPSAGIWGGLWSLPQFDDGTAALAWCAQQSIPVAHEAAMPEFTHTFTHFKLHISPLRLDLSRKPPRTLAPGMMWLKIEAALNAAIPKPVRGLLEPLLRG